VLAIVLLGGELGPGVIRTVAAAGGPPTVIATIPIPNGASDFNEVYGVAVAPDGAHVYATNEFGGDGTGSLNVIDAATNTVTATINAPDTDNLGVAVSPDGAHVYTADHRFSDLTVYDTATNQASRVIDVGVNLSNSPLDVAVSPNGTHAYTINVAFPYSVSAVDLANNTATVNIPLRCEPQGVVVSRYSRLLYTCDAGGVSVIDTATNTITGTIPLSDAPAAMAVSPDGTRLYVASANAISVIDTTANVVVGTISGVSPGAMAIAPDGIHLYVVSAGSNSLRVVDTVTRAVGAAVGVGSGPNQIVINRTGTRAYIANMYDNTVSVVALT
jgi:YVTN family beta-propeller protein